MTVDVSKLVAYVVLTPENVAVSKLNVYAVLTPENVAVSKFLAYTVLRPFNLEVSKFNAYAVLLYPGTMERRLAFIGADVITGGISAARLPFIGADVIGGGAPEARLTYIGAEPISGGNPAVRCSLIGLEVLYALPEEGPVATDVLPTRSPIAAPLSTPGLPGLTWSVNKRPMFRTQVASSVSGVELRTSRMEYPIYQYEIKFDFLDSRGVKTQYDELAGFFMRMRGAWNAFLYQDPNAYSLVGQEVGVADGGTTGFIVTQTVGGFTDPIGQFDLKPLFSFAEADVNVGADTVTVASHNLATGYGPLQLTTAGTLPAGLSPLTNYWIIRVNANTLQFAASLADALAGTPVPITDDGTGTFLASNSVAVYIDGTEVPVADYVVTEPNEVVFDSAPSMGTITVSCKYFYVCRFTDDEADFEEFMERLWSLQTLAFQSILSVT